MEKYNPQKIEAKWQNQWQLERDSWRVDSGKKPYYVLDMIPYPSGEGLHVGHWFPYIIADVWARYHTLLGEQVLSPVGFDAFGLPAENAAIKTKTPPQIYTENSIANFSRQIREMGKMYDWSTLITTSAPEYYKWTQWLFIQLYKNGLAYRKSAPVWWCPSCQTVLANEQVVDGKCERCGTPVIKKELRQWFLKITDFAEDLLKFDGLNWPESIKTLQTNWIGKSVGTLIHFPLENGDVLKAFTTRPDTLMGVTYLVMAPEHPRAANLITEAQRFLVEQYIAQATQKSEIERTTEDRPKTGVFTGSYALHPVTKERIPVWLADYVIGSYGTGCVMGVPAHDTRDFVFAKDYKLPIVFVVTPENETADESKAYVAPGILANSGEFTGLESAEAKERITEYLVEQNLGCPMTNYRLRDWLVSRQRYWGTPIPIIYCEECGEQTVPERDLPVLLPAEAEFIPTGGSPLERHPTFKNATCPQCGGPAMRETDTLDTFVDSSWYYLRFTDPKNDQEPFSRAQVDQWMPVDFYVGGREHAILHLLYSRFIMKALNRLGYVRDHEPFKTFYGNGMIYLNGSKMSKSKGNIVNPDDMIDRYGTDALRGYILFMGPADQDVEWQTNGIVGIRRFLDKAWKLLLNSKPGNQVSAPTSKLFASYNEFLPKIQLNRCLSAMMIAANELEKSGLSLRDAEVFTQLAAPFFPHFAEEVWQKLGHQSSIFDSSWPEVAINASVNTTIAIQINGKIRGTLEVRANVSQDELAQLARSKVTSYLEGKQVVKTVVVPGRIVSFVVQ